MCAYVVYKNMCIVCFSCLFLYVPYLPILDAVSSSHDPVGSNQRPPASVPPLTVPLILQRDLEMRSDNMRIQYSASFGFIVVGIVSYFKLNENI